MTDTAMRRRVLEDAVFLQKIGMRPVIVHGAGPWINAILEKRFGREPNYHPKTGLRITDEEALIAVTEAFRRMNRTIVREIRRHGGSAGGVDGGRGLVRVRRVVVDELSEKYRMPLTEADDHGFVGNVTAVNARTGRVAWRTRDHDQGSSCRTPALLGGLGHPHMSPCGHGAQDLSVLGELHQKMFPPHRS